MSVEQVVGGEGGGETVVTLAAVVMAGSVGAVRVIRVARVTGTAGSAAFFGALFEVAIAVTA
mgnify:CR=1 FL=1